MNRPKNVARYSPENDLILRPYKTPTKLFLTIFGGVNGRHLLAAQKYLSEQHGKFPLYPHVASSRQHVHTHPSLPRIHFKLTIQAITSRLRRHRRTPQFPIRTRILSRVIARSAPARQRRLTVQHRTEEIVSPAGVGPRPIGCGSAVLHCAVWRDELEFGVGVAVVGSGVVAGRAACYCGFAGAGFGAQLGAEAGVFGGVVACGAAGLEGFCEGEGEEGVEVRRVSFMAGGFWWGTGVDEDRAGFWKSGSGEC
jgi:hypothetical protein